MIRLLASKLQLSKVILLTHVLSPVARSDDWPQWRGPNRDSVWDEKDLPQAFPADGLKVAWQAEAGWGFSSPVVAAGRVFLHDSIAVKPTAQERVRSWDAATGQEFWTRAYEVAYEDWAFDPAQEIGPVATPIVEAGKVYCLGRVGNLKCLDAKSGEVLWSRNLQQDYQVAFSPGVPSPLVQGDLLILLAGGKPGACVIAFDKDTGREVWKALDESLSFSSPIVISSGGVRQLIVWTQESVTALNPRTGAVYWRHPVQTNSDYIVSTPVYENDRLLVGGMMLQLAADKPEATLLWPASKATARRVFSNTSTALLHGDYVYSARSSGELICVEAATGKPVWESDKATSLKNGASIHITPNGDTDLLYTDRGELIRARLTPHGYDEISRASVLQPTFPFAGRNVAWSPPAFANGRLYARSGKQLVCVRLPP